MKKLSILLALATLLPMTIFAAQVYGSLKENGQSVSGVKVEINCNGRAYGVSTDSSGSYNLYAGEKGKCTFKVNYKGQAPTFEIYSYDNPVRYDFDLVNENGRYALKRK
jgi:hypothetical protein